MSKHKKEKKYSVNKKTDFILLLLLLLMKATKTEEDKLLPPAEKGKTNSTFLTYKRK